MTGPGDQLDRIASALERLSPPLPGPADALAHAAYAWRGERLVPIALEALPLDWLLGLDRQRDALLGNLRRLARGYAAHDALLWGARGSGKSALAKSAVAAVQREHPALGLVVAPVLETLPGLFAALAPVGRPFAIFVDDIGVDAPANARALRSLLEGGAEPRPANARLIVTSNRRHLQPRDMDGQASAINPRDTADDQLALADRFGLSLGFHALDQEVYLAIVTHYAAAYNLGVNPGDALEWAQRRGSRSGRVAWQYIVEVAGQAGRSL